jgi:hypothetical protein
MENENPLWLRVAAFRGIHVSPRGARAYVAGDRFQVQVSRVDARKAAAIERVATVVSDPGCQGVIGEIVVARNDVARNDVPTRARVQTLRGYVSSVLGWHVGLIDREAERLAQLQPDRRSG